MIFKPAPSYNKKELIACGNGDLFGPDNGRLPADEMLMFDSIDQIDQTSGKYSNGKIIAHLNIEETLWFFNVHFKSDPVMPGCLGLDAMWQLLGFYLCWLELPGYGRALGSDKVKFFGGEPLLQKKQIQKIVTSFPKRHSPNFYVTSNSTLIDQNFIDFSDEYGLKLTFSIDGDAHTTAENRKVL